MKPEQFAGFCRATAAKLRDLAQRTEAHPPLVRQLLEIAAELDAVAGGAPEPETPARKNGDG